MWGQQRRIRAGAWLAVVAAIGLTIPALGLRLGLAHLAHAPLDALIFGLAILGAAFLLAWAAEVAQLDVSQALALAGLALIAVLPEYAVSLYFAWEAAARPEYAAYATANMTGANRLLIGVAWPLVVVLFWLRSRRPAVRLAATQRTEVGFLGLATLYSFVLPLRGSISLLDAGVLIGLFAAYTWRLSRLPAEEPHLIGPARLIGSLPAATRRLATLALFVFSGTVIFVSAEPFAEALVHAGGALGIDEFLLVQWLAPLASEAPEVIVATLFAMRGLPAAGLGALVSSKVNQWTLLIGGLPLAYSLAGGQPWPLPLDQRQIDELWLTAAQSLLGVALLVNLRLALAGSALLLAMFLVQLLVPGSHGPMSLAYLALAAAVLATRGRDLLATFSAGLLDRRTAAGDEAGERLAA